MCLISLACRSAWGAGGREFKSRRPDQSLQKTYFEVSCFFLVAGFAAGFAAGFGLNGVTS